MRVEIHGTNLPGRVFCDAHGSPYDNVHVGVQLGRDPDQLVPADARVADWTLDVDVIERDGALDFRGAAVQGKRGERFLYLTWGAVTAAGEFKMFRRAKLMLHRIDPDVLDRAVRTGALSATVDLTGPDGGPRCARIDPPAIEWSVPTTSPEDHEQSVS